MPRVTSLNIRLSETGSVGHQQDTAADGSARKLPDLVCSTLFEARKRCLEDYKIAEVGGKRESV